MRDRELDVVRKRLAFFDELPGYHVKDVLKLPLRLLRRGPVGRKRWQADPLQIETGCKSSGFTALPNPVTFIPSRTPKVRPGL